MRKDLNELKTLGKTVEASKDYDPKMLDRFRTLILRVIIG